jgi:SAM-dependent methyltransferase
MDAFFQALEEIREAHPYLVVLLMHEASRNLYPTDPYITLPEVPHRLKAVAEMLPRLTRFAREAAPLGSYFLSGAAVGGPAARREDADDLKRKTGEVYGPLWTGYGSDIVDEAERILKERFGKNDIPYSHFEGGDVLDFGCGSGRFSLALARLGAGKVTGVDYGDEGLALARNLAVQEDAPNVTFEKRDILRSGLADESFDFVFSNGVAHHTGDLPRVIHEIHRLLRPGGRAWCYIYADGGVFWHFRKRANAFMKSAGISQAYASRVLDLIGMPSNRFIFQDNWYVPIETHTSRKDFETMLRDAGFVRFRRCVEGRPTDLDWLAVHGTEEDRKMWGDGELRYLLEK